MLPWVFCVEHVLSKYSQCLQTIPKVISLQKYAWNTCPSYSWLGRINCNQSGDPGSPKQQWLTSSNVCEAVCRALPKRNISEPFCDQESYDEENVFKFLFSFEQSYERLWLWSDAAACLESQRLHYSKVHRFLQICPQYDNFLRFKVARKLRIAAKRDILEMPELQRAFGQSWKR